MRYDSRSAPPLLLAVVLLVGAWWSPQSALASGSGPLANLRGLLPGTPEGQPTAIPDALEAAAAAQAAAEALEQQVAALRAEAVKAPARSRELTDLLKVDRQQSLQEWMERLPANADVETLESVLDQERLAADNLRAQITELTGNLARSLSAPARAGAQLADQQRRIDELATPVVAADGEPPELTEARRALNSAERRRLVAERELRQLKLDTTRSQQRLMELELRTLRHRLSLREPRLELLQERIVDLGRSQLEALVVQLEERKSTIPANDGAAAAVAQGNRDLAQEMLVTNERLANQRRILAEDDRLLERDLAGLRDSQSRVVLGGQSEQVGIWLWAELRRLEPVSRLQDRLAQVRRSLGEQRLRLIALHELQRDLEDIPAAVEQLRANERRHEDHRAGSPEASADLLHELLLERDELLDQLEPLIWRRVAALEQTERNLTERLAANQAIRQTLDRHLLWIRSHPPVGADWTTQLPAGARDLVKGSRLATTARLMREDFDERPLRYVASLALVAVLWILRRRARPRLERLAHAIRDVRKDRYSRTLESLGWTFFAALPWPATFWLLGQLLQGLGMAGKYSDSLGRAFEGLALPALTLMFLANLVRDGGLAHAHFRWSKPRREVLQQWLPRLIAVLLPIYFLVSLAFLRDQELAISVQARLAIVAGALFSAWALWDLLAPNRLWHRRGVDREPSRLRRLMRAGLPSALVLTAVLSMAGYVYSTALLLNAAMATVGLLTCLTVVHGMLSRWFILGERRLAYRRLQHRRELEAAAGESPAIDDGGEAITIDPDEDITLAKVSAHNRGMLRALRLSLLVFGLAWIWSDVLPALARFDDFVLWSINAVDAAGQAVQEPVTLLSVMLGLLTLALTVVAARNLPGVIEIGLLSRVGMDAATRYAVTSVSRYLIVLVGVMVGFGLLGLRWSQLQWMAAALTVGLGFGLQEIFANFVSGLILLFERPFRVGDVITVNNLDGTVTKIRTRATTILDFDNKEIVVPNKSFITGQLVNWTLSDEITRITIKVGVDYGTDPATVHRLLMQAAEENHRVLKDRAPRSWLLEFGASTLEFELRLFVGAMADRLAVRDEINTRLIQLFEENGIAFAYPQLDLHVRDVPEQLIAGRPAKEPAPAPAARPAKEPGPDA